MEIQTLVVGEFAVNCYLLSQNGEFLVVDPGGGFRRIKQAIDSYENSKVVGILLTHGHFDHIGAVDKLVEEYHCPVYCCQEDEILLRNYKYNSMGPFGGTVSSEISWFNGSKLSLGSFDIEILYTPGHTKGSCMFIIGNCLFSGDTIFRESIGRTDLYGGSCNQILQSIQIIRELPFDMAIYPGHEGATTVGHELQFNPFL